MKGKKCICNGKAFDQNSAWDHLEDRPMGTEHTTLGVQVGKSPRVSVYWLPLAVLGKYYQKESELRKKIDLSAVIEGCGLSTQAY